MSDFSLSFEICEPLTEHARLIMDWRNDPVTLSMSYHREPKVWESFWLEYQSSYLGERPGPVFLVDKGERVGFLRFRSVPHPTGLLGKVVDISINLAPDRRGKGLGSAA